MRPDSSNLTPGVIDGYAKRAFTYGACGGLAIVIHEATGWPIVAITDSHNVLEGRAGGGSALHWGVQHPSGKFLDIDGLHELDDIVENYEGEADDGEAAWGISNREDAREWYVLAQGEPIPLELIKSFVDPLLNEL